MSEETAARPGSARVTVYTRVGCPACEKAEDRRRPHLR